MCIWKHGLAVILLRSHFGYVEIHLEEFEKMQMLKLKYAISAPINIMKVLSFKLATSFFTYRALHFPSETFPIILVLCYNLNNIPLKSM